MNTYHSMVGPNFGVWSGTRIRKGGGDSAVGPSVLGLKSVKQNKITQNFVRTDSNLAVSEARVTVM